MCSTDTVKDRQGQSAIVEYDGSSTCPRRRRADPHDDRAAQGGAGTGPVRRPGGEELSRGTGKEPSPARSEAHPGLDQEAPVGDRHAARTTTSALHRLQLVQEKMDLEKELGQLGDKVDLSSLEAAFVKTAGKYAERKGISYAGVAPAGRIGRDAEEGRNHALERGSSVGRARGESATARRRRPIR